MYLSRSSLPKHANRGSAAISSSSWRLLPSLHYKKMREDVRSTSSFSQSANSFVRPSQLDFLLLQSVRHNVCLLILKRHVWTITKIVYMCECCRIYIGLVCIPPTFPLSMYLAIQVEPYFSSKGLNQYSFSLSWGSSKSRRAASSNRYLGTIQLISS